MQKFRPGPQILKADCSKSRNVLCQGFARVPTGLKPISGHARAIAASSNRTQSHPDAGAGDCSFPVGSMIAERTPMADAPVTDDLWTTGEEGGAAPTLRTVLILDLADSTALVDRLGDQRAAELIRRHDRLARDLIRRHRGREIDKTDGFLMLFERPVQAVGFALEYQRRLGELAQLEGTPMAARIGIHVGEVVLWENAPEEIARGAKPMEVEGLAKPVAARLMGVALPGQILLSGMAYGLAQRAEAELRSLGRVPVWKHHGNYRFKGVSEPLPVFEVGENGVAHFRAPPTAGKAQRVVPWWQRPATIISELLIAAVAFVAVAYVTLKPEPGIAFSARDWVVVGDLVNRTGQQVLDDSLDLAFRQGLSQSRHVNVLSTLQVRDALARMQRDPAATQVDRGIGAELAQREQARALLLPSVADTGGSYRLSVEVVDPGTQATVWVTSQTARAPEDLLPAMDSVIGELREKLGESLQAIETDTLPLAQATTSNLEALRTYSIARKQYELLKIEDAKRLYDRAIELDPDFAMAYAAIASMYLPLGRMSEGLVAANKAISLRERLSTRERAYIDALIASVEDPEKAVGRWRDYGNLYPDLGVGQNNAGLLLWQELNRCDEALPLLQQAWASRDPLRFASGHFTGFCRLWRGEPEQAQASFEAALQLNGNPMAFGLADVYTYEERFADAERVLFTEHPGLTPTFAVEQLARRVTWLAYQGRLDEAQQAAKDLEGAARKAGVSAAESRARLFQAAIDLHAGKEFAASASALDEMALASKQELSRYPAAIHAALYALIAERQGELKLAARIADELASHPPKRADLSAAVLLNVVQARLNGNQRAALTQLSGAPQEFFQIRVARAHLSDALSEHDQELVELRWIEEHRSRAFAEYNGFFAAQVLNVLDVNAALLRQIQLEPDEAKRNTLRSRLAARWAKADASLREQVVLQAAQPAVPPDP